VKGYGCAEGMGCEGERELRPEETVRTKEKGKESLEGVGRGRRKLAKLKIAP
jgi:hypothetical protein